MLPQEGRPGIALQRTYTRRNSVIVGRFGAGWTGTYGESLTVNGSIVTVKAGNGSALS